VAAAASDRLFVLADQAGRAGVADFYALRLGPAGQVVSLRRVPRLPAVDGQIYGLAVSADGSEFAVATMPRVPGSGSARVSVFGPTSAVTSRSWAAVAGAASKLSWASGGRLAFYWGDARRPARSGLRILSTAGRLGGEQGAPGGGDTSLLSQSRLAVAAQNHSGSAQITADGSMVLTAAAEASSGPAAAQTRLGEFSAASGRLLRWLPLTGQNTGVTYCGVLWASRADSKLITQCGDVQEEINGSHVTRIRLPVIIEDSVVGYQNSFAW
jgi:hypothetical protein